MCKRCEYRNVKKKSYESFNVHLQALRQRKAEEARRPDLIWDDMKDEEAGWDMEKVVEGCNVRMKRKMVKECGDECHGECCLLGWDGKGS